MTAACSCLLVCVCACVRVCVCVCVCVCVQVQCNEHVFCISYVSGAPRHHAPCTAIFSYPPPTHSLFCPALPCPALPFPALPCPSLPCPSLPFPCNSYVKALLRRSQALEKLDKVEEALIDLKAVQQIDSQWVGIGSNIARLQAVHDKKMEELKDEALGKLKDLGNSILGNFGMSMNDFNFKQDPKTGGWTLGGTSGA